MKVSIYGFVTPTNAQIDDHLFMHELAPADLPRHFNARALRKMLRAAWRVGYAARCVKQRTIDAERMARKRAEMEFEHR